MTEAEILSLGFTIGMSFGATWFKIVLAVVLVVFIARIIRSI
jgi:hypothetical protein